MVIDGGQYCYLESIYYQMKWRQNRHLRSIKGNIEIDLTDKTKIRRKKYFHYCIVKSDIKCFAKPIFGVP